MIVYYILYPSVASNSRPRALPSFAGIAGTEALFASVPVRTGLAAGFSAGFAAGFSAGFAAGLAAGFSAWVERFGWRGTEPFELFRSEFGQNSWNPKKTTKSHLCQVAARAKPTRQKKQRTIHFTRRGRRKTEKKETGGDKRGLVAGR